MVLFLVSAPSVAVLGPPVGSLGGQTLGSVCCGVGVVAVSGDIGDRIDSVGPQGCSQPLGLAL